MDDMVVAMMVRAGSVLKKTILTSKINIYSLSSLS